MDETERLQRTIGIVRALQADATTQGLVLPSPPSSEAGDQTQSSRAPSAFVSWAHGHSSWNAAQRADWQEQVATFSASLRHYGVDADVDLFHLDEPQDWTRFGARGIQKANHTLIVLSEAWAERWAGTNAPTEGAGAAAEADYLRGLFVKNQESWQRRLLLIMFPGVSDSVVPPDLERVARVYVDPIDPDDYESVIRNLTGQPRYPKPDLGVVPTLGPVMTDPLVALRAQLSQVRKEERDSSSLDEAAKDRLAMKEAALRGFIDAAEQESE